VYICVWFIVFFHGGRGVGGTYQKDELEVTHSVHAAHNLYCVQVGDALQGLGKEHQ